MTTPQDYPQQPYPQPGSQSGSQPGYPQPGYPQPGYAQPGYAQPGYAQPGYPQPGYPQPGGTPQGQQPGYGAQSTSPYGVPAYPGGGQYGGVPGYSGGAQYGGAFAQQPTRPGTVNTAFLLWMLILVAGVASSALLFTGGYYDAMEQAMRELGTAGAEAQAVLRFGRAFFIGIAVVGLAISLFIYLFFGLKMRSGRNWARIVLTVLGGLSALSGAAGGSASMTLNEVSVAIPQSSVILGWTGAALAVAAIIAMFLAPSNTYFRESKAYRAAR